MSCLKELKAQHVVKSDREFCLRVGFTSQNFSQIVTGKREVTLDLVRRAVELFNFNPVYLFSGEGEHLKTVEDSVSGGVSIADIQYIPSELWYKYAKEINEGVENTFHPYIYKSSYSADELRLFEVSDPSLGPYLQNGDVLITRKIPESRWGRLIRDYYIYVVVKDTNIYISRIISHLKSDAEIELLDVNIQKDTSMVVSKEEINEIWEITHYIKRWTTAMNNESATMTERLDNINLILINNGNTNKELNQTMEKLLRQIRDLNS